MSRLVCVIAGRVARHAWTHGRVVEDVCVGLARRGWRVSLLAHSIDDPRPLEQAGARIETQHPFVSHGTHFPLGYERWVRERLRGAGSAANDATPSAAPARAHAQQSPARHLVLTRLIDPRIVPPGAVVLPLESEPREWWRAMLATRGVVGLAASLVREHGVLAHMFSSSDAHARVHDDLLTYAPLSARTGTARDSAGVDPAVPARVDSLARQLAGQLAAERVVARRALGLGPGKWAVLVSCVEPAPLGIEPSLCSLLRAASTLAARARERPTPDSIAPESLASGPRTPVVMVLSHQPFHVHRRELRARVDEAGWNALGQGVRLLGSTEQMRAALAACDAVALLPRPHQRPTLRASRLACDARFLGVPLLGSRQRAGEMTASPADHATHVAEDLLLDDAELSRDNAWINMLTRAQAAGHAETRSPGVATETGDREHSRRGLHVDEMIERLERALAR